jgi:indole-3-glycerol phosphate synthase
MGVWLDQILAVKKAEIAQLVGVTLPVPPARRVVQLARPTGAPLRIVAEIKRRSPSAGPLSTRLGVAERAAAYERAGAAMISVLCDRTYFDGSPSHLRAARAATSVPLLCKDFILHERQLALARAWGADAALLIVRCLAPGQLLELVHAARVHDLVPLVEVTNEAELAIALDAKAPLVGVNARDLDTQQMDLARAARVLAAIPDGTVRLHLSGVSSANDVARLAGSAADAALIGEILMRADDPEPLLRSLTAAAGGLAAAPSAP